MTFNCYNGKDLERAWAQIQPGDCINLVVAHKDDYQFHFSHPTGYSEAKGQTAEEIAKAAEGSNRGCCC